MGEVPPRDHSTFSKRDVHGHSIIVYRRAADIRPDLDYDPRRTRLCVRRAYIGNLQGVSGGILWLVDRWQCCAIRSRHDHCVSADAVLQQSGDRAMKVRKFFASVWLDAVSLIIISIVFIVPFIFIFLTASK